MNSSTLTPPPTTMHYYSTITLSTSPPPAIFPFALAPPIRTASPVSLSRASSSSPSPSLSASASGRSCNTSRNGSNHARRLAHPHAPPTPTSLSTLLSHSPIFPPTAAHSWWTVLEPRPTPNAPHLVIPVVRDHAALVHLVGAWPSEPHAVCPKAMASWIVNHLSRQDRQEPSSHKAPSTPTTTAISKVSVVHQGAEVRIDLLDPRPLLHALCNALELPTSCPTEPQPSQSTILIDPQAAYDARGQAIAQFLTRLTCPSVDDNAASPGAVQHLPAAPAPGTQPLPAALAHAHRILRTPSGSRIVDLGAELGVATLLSSSHAWTPVTTLIDYLLTHVGQVDFIVTPVANERIVKQAVALYEPIVGCEGPKIVAYAPAACSVPTTSLLACNRATPMPAQAAAASAKNDKVWAKVAAVAQAAHAPEPVPQGLGVAATQEHLDTPTMQLALTLLQYPSVLRRCVVSAESAPLATYAMRVAGLVGKNKKAGAGQDEHVRDEVEWVAAKVVKHAVAVLGGVGIGQ